MTVRRYVRRTALIAAVALLFIHTDSEPHMQSDNGLQSVLKYLHGAAHSGVNIQDVNVTNFLADYINAVESGETVGYELERFLGIREVAKPGDTREEQITRALLDNLENPSLEELYVVGYSGGAGTLGDIFANRHLNDEAQADRVRIQQRLNLSDEEESALERFVCVLVDPFMGLWPSPLSDEQIENVNATIGERCELVIVAHAPEQPRINKDFLGHHAYAAWSILREAFATDERFRFVAAEGFNHGTIILDPEDQKHGSAEGVIAVATITDYYLVQVDPSDEESRQNLGRLKELTDGHPEWEAWQGSWLEWNEEDWDRVTPWLDEPSSALPSPPNQPPTVTAKPSKKSLSTYVPIGGGGGGDVFCLEPSWKHTGCFSVTDPDGDNLNIHLSSAPRYGRADLTVSGSAGKYSVTVLYQVPASELLAVHDGRGLFEASFSVTATDPHGKSATETLELTVEVFNRDPEAVAEAITIEGAGADPVFIDVLDNDSDPDGDPLSIVSVGTSSGMNGIASCFLTFCRLPTKQT